MASTRIRPGLQRKYSETRTNSSPARRQTGRASELEDLRQRLVLPRPNYDWANLRAKVAEWEALTDKAEVGPRTVTTSLAAREAVAGVVERIVVKKPAHYGPVFDPGRVQIVWR